MDACRRVTPAEPGGTQPGGSASACPAGSVSRQRFGAASFGGRGNDASERERIRSAEAVAHGDESRVDGSGRRRMISRPWPEPEWVAVCKGDGGGFFGAGGTTKQKHAMVARWWGQKRSPGLSGMWRWFLARWRMGGRWNLLVCAQASVGMEHSEARGSAWLKHSAAVRQECRFGEP